MDIKTCLGLLMPIFTYERTVTSLRFCLFLQRRRKKRNTENVSGLNKHDFQLFSKNNISVVLFIMSESSTLTDVKTIAVKKFIVEFLLNAFGNLLQ